MPIPTTMLAVTASAPGGPDVLVVAQHPVPQTGPTELLVKVLAAGVNRPDCLQRAGHYPPPKGAGPILGLEIAGDVVHAGGRTSRFRKGDRVMALVPSGGYAQFAAVDESNALPVPGGLAIEAAGGVPENYFTVWSNVFDRGKLVPGEWFLVHGGTSGIGTTAIQLAKAFGARVVATAGSAAKCQAMRDLGADHAIDYNAQDFVAECRRIAPEGIHLTLDMVGGDYVGKNWAVAAVEGRIVQIATLNGPSEADFSVLMRKRLHHTGSTLRARDVAFKATIARALEAKVLPLLADGTVRVVVDRTFPLAAVADAHRLMEQSGHIGKIILTP